MCFGLDWSSTLALLIFNFAAKPRGYNIARVDDKMRQNSNTVPPPIPTITKESCGREV